MSFVAVFIDWENVEKTVKQDLGSVLDFQEFVNVIKTNAEQYGRLSGIFAYGDFDKKDTEGYVTRLVNLGIEPKHVVTKTAHEYLKGSTDIELSLDILETMYAYPHITDFLFVGGDGDLRHVIKRLRMNGKMLHLMGFEHNTNQFLIELVNDFVALDPSSEIMRKITKTEREKKMLSLLNDTYVHHIVKDLDYMENQKSKRFIGLNLFRRRITEKYPLTKASDALTIALDYGLIDTYKVPNPDDSANPTTAAKLNRDNPVVQHVLNQ